MPVLDQDEAEYIISSLRTVVVVAYQKTEADIIYDWNVGRSFRLATNEVGGKATNIDGHTSAFLCIEDTNDAFRSYDRVEFVNALGDHLTTIELAKSYRIREWFEEAEFKMNDQSKPPPSKFTIDQRFPVAIYATDETLKPRRMQVEPGYRLAAYHAPSTGVQPNPTKPPVTVAYRGRRRITTLSV